MTYREMSVEDQLTALRGENAELKKRIQVLEASVPHARWEYVWHNKSTNPWPPGGFTTLGLQGWEYVGQDGVYDYIFKRRLP